MMLPSRRPTRPTIFAAFLLAGLTYFFLLHNPWRPSSLFGHRRPEVTLHSPTVPKKLWYKLGPKGLSEAAREWTSTCIKLNPGYEVVFMTDSSADRWVEDTFGLAHPDIVEIYSALTVPIWKADILRYLIAFAEGGVYLDLDMTCEVPFDDWIPPAHKDKTNLVVGWEFDVGWQEPFVRNFESWAIMAKPRSPHMWLVIQEVMKFLREKMREHSVPASGLTLAMTGDVVDTTGPRRFTKGILMGMEEAFNTTLKDVQELMEPKLVGDILVLPGYALALSANHYNSSLHLPPTFARHQYAGSWKNDHGGEGP